MDQAAALRNLMDETRRPTAVVDPTGDRLPNGEAAPTSGPRLLAVTSGKGGVGKSNVSVNLGLCLARMGRRTWLWDVDLGLGNADILLGVSPRYDLGHVVFGDRTLEEIIIEGPEGLRLVPGGSGWHQMAQLSQWRLNRLVSDLASLGSDADFILMDTGAGLGRGVIQFALAAQEVIIVTTPEPTALADAYGLLKVVFDVNPGVRVYLVINQARNSGEAHEAYRRLNDAVERFLHRSVLWLGSLPQDEAVPASVRRRQPFVLAFPRSPAAQAVERIAARLLGEGARDGASESGGGLGGVLRRMVRLLRR